VESLIPLAVALVGGIIAWIGSSALARRAKSGSPKTAEAETLFSELRQLKDDYKEELESYREENKALRLRVNELEKRLAELERSLPRREADG
jgi:flagellar biosynthesis/type III secretory pathway M-ring protein FliF/YscJ